MYLLFGYLGLFFLIGLFVNFGHNFMDGIKVVADFGDVLLANLKVVDGFGEELVGELHEGTHGVVAFV